jgi:hypothetical protein
MSAKQTKRWAAGQKTNSRMLHDRIIRWSLPGSVGETAVNLTSGYELVRSSCGDRVWRDVDRCKSSEIDQILNRITLKWWENWRHVDLKPCKNKRVGGKSWCRRQRVMIRQSCGLRDLRLESTCATLAPSFGRPSRAPGRFAWIWAADSWRLSRNSFIRQSSRTDGRTDGWTASRM